MCMTRPSFVAHLCAIEAGAHGGGAGGEGRGWEGVVVGEGGDLLSFV